MPEDRIDLLCSECQQVIAQHVDGIRLLIHTRITSYNVCYTKLLRGRQEGAQLDAPSEVDVIAQLRQKANDFKLLAESEGKQLHTSFEPNLFMATLQIALLGQIIQNFLQNALKFTPKGKSVITSYSIHYTKLYDCI